MSRVSVGIVGASGILGAEVIRLLADHPHVELTQLCANTSAGLPLADVRPSLAGLGARRFDALDIDRLTESCEVILVALPHGQSAELIAELIGRDRSVIDLGSDFRLSDKDAYPKYYDRGHPCPELLDRAVYSLPELTGALPEGTRLIANPGCFATALALGCVPLVDALAPGARIAATGVTGSSGSGIAPSAGVHHALRRTNFRAYKALRHQHLGEVRQLMRVHAGRELALDFIPHSGPFVRGIHLTLTVRNDELVADPLERLEQAYGDAALIGVAPGPVDLGAVIGSCRTQIGVERGEEATAIFIAIDNLLKGGSGQAVQNLNLLMGWPELTALPTLGIWP